MKSDDRRLKARIPRQETGRLRSIIIAGRPGTGKTSIAESIIDNVDPKNVVRVPVGSKDFLDFGSFYVPSQQPNGKIEIQSPVTIKKLVPLFCENIKDEYGILVIDDVTSNSPQIQSSLLEVTQFGTIGDDNKLGINVLLVLTGNNAEKNTFACEWGDALLGRSMKIDYEPVFEEWMSLRCNEQIHPGVIAFLKDNPEFFAPSLGDPKFSDKSGKTPSPRDWTSIGLPLATYKDIYKWTPCILHKSLNDFCSSMIGERAGNALASFLKTYNKYPTGKELYENPNSWKQLSHADRTLPSVGIACSFALRAHVFREVKNNRTMSKYKEIANNYIDALLVIADGNYELNSYALHTTLHSKEIPNKFKEDISELFLTSPAFQSKEAKSYFKAIADIKKWTVSANITNE